ncbi:porin [Acidisoma silvae]|uniref:Porin n=1 Tax=Acidisoma silvae TaxID=2802396 RepID=A0A963YVJ4_9PROT|nr:porin [Acidisoma silvae]MCB8876848.1 porin [Acidisoma silvae]
MRRGTRLWAAKAAAIVLGLGFTGSASAQVSNPDLTMAIAPGSAVMRLGGRIAEWYGVSGFTGQSYKGRKYSGSGLAGYIRLYPGFDGVAANGLHYGAQAEIHENTASNSTAGAMGGTLYILRDFGYLGLPQLGLLRFGQQEGALYLFDTGRFDSGPDGFDDGAWSGDVEHDFVKAAARAIYPWTWSRTIRTTDKIDYISPTWSGVSFGLSFEPNQTAENDAPAVTSTTTSTDLRRNTLELGGRYKAVFDGIGLNVSGGYMTAGAVAYNTPSNTQPYQGLSVWSFGAELSDAGFTLGANTKFGRMNGQFEPDYKGGATAVGWLAGGAYTIAKFSFGGSYFVYDSQGDWSSPATEGTRRETGLAAGASYGLMPGVKLFASYFNATRHQDGYNFLAGEAGSSDNDTMAQVFAVGTWLYW